MLMKTRVEVERRWSFREYLDAQPLARKREIQAAEREYLAKQRIGNNESGGFAIDPVEQAFLESMEGYCETPAGPEPPVVGQTIPGLDISDGL